MASSTCGDCSFGGTRLLFGSCMFVLRNLHSSHLPVCRTMDTAWLLRLLSLRSWPTGHARALRVSRCGLLVR